MIARNLKWLGSVAAAVLPLVAGYAQTPSSTASSTASSTPAAAAPSAPNPGDAAPGAQSGFAQNVAEVVKLAHSSVGDEVLIAFIKNSQSPFGLSTSDILALKDAGLSSPVVAAMLSHDAAMKPRHEALAGTPPAAPGTSSPYTYYQKLYGPASDAETARGSAPAPAPASTQSVPPAPLVPAAPSAQPMPAAQPFAPAQPVPPQQPAAPAPVVVQQPPPAPQVEVVAAAPGAGYYWAPGYWSWRGGAWIWIGGCWAPRPYPGAVWIGGRWGWSRRGYVWIGGRWR
jgi:hypothetical protein